MVERSSRLGFAILIASASLACADSEVPTMSDASSVFTAPVVTFRASASPVFTLGDDPESLLHLLRGGVFLGSKVVIANSGYNELLFVNQEGGVVARHGREGLGPGEYRYITGVFADGDEVLVWDEGNQRLSRVDSTGSFLGSTNIRLDGFPGVKLIGAAGGVGLFEHRESGFPGEGRVEASLVRPEVRYALVDLESGSVVRTISRSGPESWMRRDGTRDPHGGFGVVFGRDVGAAVSSFGSVIAQTDSLLFSVFQAGGDSTLHLLESTNRVSSAEWEQWVRDSLRANTLSLRERLGPESDFLARMEQFRLEMLEGLPARSTLPAFSHLLAGSDGRLWIREYPEPGSDSVAWIGVDNEFEPQRRIITPIGREILDISDDAVLASRMLETGEYQVEKFSLVETSGATVAGRGSN